MRTLRAWLLRFGGLFNKRQSEQEIGDEIESNLQFHIDDGLRDGMSPKEARRQALIRLGGIEPAKEAWRDRRGIPFLESLWKDVVYAFRTMGRSKGWTAVAILSLALGIGAVTAVFSVADPLLVRKLPVRSPDELFILRTVFPDRPSVDSVPYALLEQLRDQDGPLSHLWTVRGGGVAGPTSLVMEKDVQVASLRMAWVSGNYFDALGVDAVEGRAFSEEDERTDAAPVAVISSRLWNSRFGGDPNVIGGTVQPTILPYSFTIIGVADPRFHGVNVDFDVDVWVPRHHEPLLAPLFKEGAVAMMGRLRPGRTIEEAQAQVDVAYDRISSSFEGDEDQRIQVSSGASGYSQLRPQFLDPLLVLMAATGAVLLVACANVAGLLLVRGTSRRKELTVRLVIGATRARIVSQLLTECLLVAILGGLCGLVVAYLGGHLLLEYLPPESGFVSRANLNIRVLGFTATVSMLSILLFGLVPIIRTANLDLNSALKGESSIDKPGFGRRFLGLSKLTVVGQIAFSLLLLVSAGLLVRTFQNLNGLEAGFDRQNVLQFSVHPYTPAPGTSDPGDRLFHRMTLQPGVEAATYYFFSGMLDIGGAHSFTPIRMPGSIRSATEAPEAVVFPVGPRYFETLGIPLIAGRDFGLEDQGRVVNPISASRAGENRRLDPAGLPVAVISGNMASSLFSDQNPIGRTVIAGSNEFEIVGVAWDTRHGVFREPTPWVLYRINHRPDTYLNTFAVRTEGDPSSVVQAIQTLVSEVDPGYYTANISTIDELVAATYARERFVGLLAGMFGILALFLASIGIHGLVSYIVGQRTREIAIRVALGAKVFDVVRMISREIAGVLAVGIVCGLLAAWATTRLLSSLLFGLTPTAPWTIASATLLLIACALAASCVPVSKAVAIEGRTCASDL